MKPLVPCAPLVMLACFVAWSPACAQTWTQTGAPSNNWSAIACSADGTKLIAAAGGQSAAGQIYTSTNAGTNWTLAGAPTLSWMAVASSADGRKLAGVTYGYGSGIYTSGDSGATWATNFVIAGRSWYSVASSADGTTLGAADFASRVLRTTNSGFSWSTNTTPIADVVSVATSADGRRITVGNNVGRLTTSTNAGVSWVWTNLLATYVSSLSSSADASALVAVAKFQGVYSSTNGGQTWFSIKPPSSSAWLVAAISADGSKIVGVADKYVIYSSTDSGATWVSNSVPPLLHWQAVASSADGNAVFAAPSDGPIWARRTTPAPVVKLANSAGASLLSWLVPSANFVLQQTPSLANPNWTDVTNLPPLNLSNLMNQITLPRSTTSAFYRLSLE